MLVPAEFLQVQDGIATAKTVTPGAALYLHNGRGLAAYTHDDVLYQAYFIAYLVLNTPNVPLNPGNPYVASKTLNGFGTMGQPDIAATLTAVAGEAIKAVWYLKWWVHLRHRPESGGAIVHLQKTGQSGTIDGDVNNVVLNSQAVKSGFTANNSYFLSQAFPEGSPTHPSYPTGQGAVAGACITVLRFFFNGTFVIPAPLVPSSNGTTTAAYVPLQVSPRSPSMANCTNSPTTSVSPTASIAGIHWRSDTDTS